MLHQRSMIWFDLTFPCVFPQLVAVILSPVSLYYYINIEYTKFEAHVCTDRETFRFEFYKDNTIFYGKNHWTKRIIINLWFLVFWFIENSDALKMFKIVHTYINKIHLFFSITHHKKVEQLVWYLDELGRFKEKGYIIHDLWWK